MRLLCTLALLVALPLVASSSVLAQANCPSTDNLYYIPWAGGTVLTPSHITSASHTIRLGSTNYLGSQLGVAIITNNSTGACGLYRLSYNGTSVINALTKNTNVCLGSSSDNVTISYSPLQPVAGCGGTSYLDAFLYGGYRLHTYTGSGNDHVHAGVGTDRVYGGAGDDDISDEGGTSDRAYGETNNDELWCSDGSSTICDGGGAPDDINDLAGSGDSIYGGGSTDIIWACGVKTVDCGESAPGYSDSDVLYFDTFSSSSVDCESVNLNADCFN